MQSSRFLARPSLGGLGGLMRTVAVVGRKGGSGKTTLAVHLAMGFVLRGRTTILADADPQRSAIEVFKGRSEAGETRLCSPRSTHGAISLDQEFDRESTREHIPPIAELLGWMSPPSVGF